MRASWRAEAQAAADRLDAIGELFELRRTQRGEQADWAVDTWAAVGAEVAAAFRTSLGMAGSFLRYALAMRERLPQVAAVFRAGDIDYRLFQTMVFRTDLITDAAVLARVDAELAVRASRWPSMTQGRLATEIDRVVAHRDPDAVRRARECVQGREVAIWEVGSGISEVYGRLFSTDAAALEQRLDALAATVCAGDPRTRDQRRADALGALAAGADRLVCRCGSPECDADPRPAGPVVIHVIAEQATVEGRGSTPAVVAGLRGTPAGRGDRRTGQIGPTGPAEPTDGPEPGYTPSAKLAEVVRCRDLTCRAPGCDRPATHCDIDHTIPYAQGGATHASNLKCLCRLHHLLKTFCGWRDQQLPERHHHLAAARRPHLCHHPGQRAAVPRLCAPTGDPPPAPTPANERCGERTAMMPLRTTTRAQNRAHRIATERHHNRQTRLATQTTQTAQAGPAPPVDDDDPPPF